MLDLCPCLPWHCPLSRALLKFLQLKLFRKLLLSWHCPE